jgi:hypothetical protein
MYTTGYAAGYVDNQLGLTYEDIENMPVREQREIVKERAGKMHKMNRLKYKFQNKRSTGGSPVSNIGQMTLDQRLKNIENSYSKSNNPTMSLYETKNYK